MKKKKILALTIKYRLFFHYDILISRRKWSANCAPLRRFQLNCHRQIMTIHIHILLFIWSQASKFYRFAPDVFVSYISSPSIVTPRAELLKPGTVNVYFAMSDRNIPGGRRAENNKIPGIVRDGASTTSTPFSPFKPPPPPLLKLLLWSTYGRYMPSIQFRSHLWFSPSHRRAAPYVIFILFIVSRSHPTAWVNIFLRGIARFSVPYFVSLTSLPRRDIFFGNDNFAYNVCVGRAPFITPKMKLFGMVLSTESAERGELSASSRTRRA